MSHFKGRNLILLVFALLTWANCSPNYFTAESSLILSDHKEIPLKFLEYYPTIGNLTAKIFICKTDTLDEYMTTWARLRADDHLVYWLVDNRFHNSSIYKTATIMKVIDRMDGMIIVDPERDQFYDIFGRSSENLVLGVDPQYLGALLKFDIYDHFKTLEERYAGSDFKIITLDKYNEILNELWTLDANESKNYEMILNYTSFGNMKKAHEERNMFIFLLFIWIMLWIRWIAQNQSWFLHNFQFYGIRITLIFVFKLTRLGVISYMLHKGYIPSERIIYMENRFWFDIGVWGSILIRTFSFSIFISLLYNFSKETAFEIHHRFDEMYILILGFLPATSLISLILSFSAFFGFYYIYSLLIAIWLVIIMGNIVIKMVYYCRNSYNFQQPSLSYKRSVLLTTLGCAIWIMLYEFLFSLTKASDPDDASVFGEYTLMVNNEVILMVAFTFLIRLFDRDNIETYVLNNPQNNNENESGIVNIIRRLRAAPTVFVKLPIPQIEYITTKVRYDSHFYAFHLVPS